MASTPEARLKIIAENLARAALAELKRDVQGTGTAASGASIGFGKMVFANGQLIASTATARRGLGLFQNGLQLLAFQAAGIPGPLGRAAAGIGLLGVGSLVVTGGIAGLGALALGWNVLTKDVTASTAAITKFGEGLNTASTPGQRFKVLIADLDQDLDKMTGRFRGMADFLAHVPGGGAAFIDLLEVLERRQRTKGEEAGVGAALAVRQARLAQGEALIDKLRLEADAVGKTAAETARLHAAELGLSADRTAALVAEATRLERRKEENRVLAAQKDLLQEIADISRETEQFGAFDVQRLRVPGLADFQAQEVARRATLDVAALERQGGAFGFGLGQDFFDRAQADVDAAIASFPEKAGKPAGQLMALSFLQAIAASQQGGAAGVFGALGGIATGASALKGAPDFLGPLGFGLSLVGSAFSLFDRKSDERERNEERRHRQLLGTLHDGFLRVQFLNADGTPEGGLYELRRAERLGGEPRLGGL